MYIYIYTWNPTVPCFDWKRLLLEAKQRTNGFQVYMHIYVSSQQLSFLQGTHGLPKKDQTICLKMRLYQDLAECNKCHHSIYLLNIPGSITFQNNDNVHLFWWESSQKQCVKRWFQFWFNDNTPKIPQMFFFFFFFGFSICDKSLMLSGWAPARKEVSRVIACRGCVTRPMAISLG